MLSPGSIASIEMDQLYPVMRITVVCRYRVPYLSSTSRNPLDFYQPFSGLLHEDNHQGAGWKFTPMAA